MSNPIVALFVAQYAMEDKQGRMWRVRDRHHEATRRASVPADPTTRTDGEAPATDPNKGRRSLQARHA